MIEQIYPTERQLNKAFLFLIPKHLLFFFFFFFFFRLFEFFDKKELVSCLQNFMKKRDVTWRKR